MSLEGGCACGHVRYRLATDPLFVHACACDCQRQTGGAFVLNALIENDRLERTAGEAEGRPVPTASGLPHVIHRCPRCAIAVWSYYGSLTERLAFVRVGTLDDPTILPPDVHIFTRSKLPWVILPPGAPAFEGYYDSKQLWPPESLERRKALFV